jgi:hypothetical protein
MNIRTPEKQNTGSTTLYDFSYAPLFYFIFAIGGLILGLILDYLWNWLVLTVALWHPFSSADSSAEETAPSVTIGRRMLYALFITLIGLPINAVYAGVAWGWSWDPVVNMPLQVPLMLMPIGLLWLANYLLSRYFLKLDNRQAVTVAVMMAFFTAPWLMLVIPLP